MEDQEQQEQKDEEIEYSCGYNTVSGAFHKPDCDSSCGFVNINEAIELNRLRRKIERSKKVMPLTEKGITTGHTTYKIGDKEVSQKEYDDYLKDKIEESNRRFRENQRNLLLDFIHYLESKARNLTVFNGIQGKFNALKSLDSFLDERSKKNE